MHGRTQRLVVREPAGASANDVMAAVLRDEPDWSALPASTPRPLRELLRRCLAKDAGGRPTGAAACAEAVAEPERARRRWLRWPLSLLPVLLLS